MGGIATLSQVNEILDREPHTTYIPAVAFLGISRVENAKSNAGRLSDIYGKAFIPTRRAFLSNGGRFERGVLIHRNQYIWLYSGEKSRGEAICANDCDREARRGHWIRTMGETGLQAFRTSNL